MIQNSIIVDQYLMDFSFWLGIKWILIDFDGYHDQPGWNFQRLLWNIVFMPQGQIQSIVKIN